MSDAGYYLDLYTKQKARAEKAEVALVAVRQACEGLRKAVSGLIAACEFGGGCDGSDPDTCDGCVAVNEARAALAAPAAGEEGETLMRALRDSATVSTRPPTSKP